MFEPKRLDPPKFEYARGDLPLPALYGAAFVSVPIDDFDLEIIAGDVVADLFCQLREQAEAGAP
jgi:hypothetical protein